ncbi:exonuclease domain-containing protein [Leucobacter sp. cx-169]|uniref:exonuclease domain-containing protein n=1 Tax=Leucobacter sp. cx-169 TaxID=2770549 RepID=UPI00165E297C|nr:exonuclease domain-containing protein [Leucobacter sp. cx-169]MBC9927226.1 3'-5' exonuclease [Leucobacter sp. cx-169]
MPEPTMPVWAEHLAVFDTETTGTDTNTDRIVTATVGIIGPYGTLEFARSWLINPGIPSAPEAVEIHGVTNERAAAEGADPSVAVAAILDALHTTGLPVVAYNAAFDLSILRAECERYGVEFALPPAGIIDPFIIDKAKWKFRKGKRTLAVVCELYGVELLDAHDATADAVAAGQLAQKLVTRYPGMEPDGLQRLQAIWQRDQAAGYQEFRRRSEPEFVVDSGWPVYDR